MTNSRIGKVFKVQHVGFTPPQEKVTLYSVANHKRLYISDSKQDIIK